MKLIFLLLILFLTIEYIQSKKKLMPIRSYLVVRDYRIRENRLSSYTVYDSTGNITLFKLQSSSAIDIDTVVLTSYPEKNMVGNLEGEWAEKKFNVTYSIYDKKSNKWIDGPITKASAFRNVYKTKWNSNFFHTKNTWFSNIIQVYSTSKKELIAEIRKDEPWFEYVRFEVKIYSNQCPDAIYFFITVINDHRVQLSTYDD